MNINESPHVSTSSGGSVKVEHDDTTLPLLDIYIYICLHHTPDGTIQTSVYRKPSHTNKYLDYTSYHPEHLKKALLTRAERRSSTP